MRTHWHLANRTAPDFGHPSIINQLRDIADILSKWEHALLFQPVVCPDSLSDSAH